MAHQPDKLPWDLLASNLEYQERRWPNLHVRGAQGQMKAFKDFVDAFEQTLEEATRAERARYAARYEPPDYDDLLIDDGVALKIAPTVDKWRHMTFSHQGDSWCYSRDYVSPEAVREEEAKREALETAQREKAAERRAKMERERKKRQRAAKVTLKSYAEAPPTASKRWTWDKFAPSDSESEESRDEESDNDGDERLSPADANQLCDHKDESLASHCACVLPFPERKAAAFFRYTTQHGCYEFMDLNAMPFFNIEVVKTLILHGEMEPVLRACAHPESQLLEWERAGACDCVGFYAGWEMLLEYTMPTYILLNIFYCFPDLWPSKSMAKGGSGRDYRLTGAYQHMMKYCAGEGCTSHVVHIPHWDFLGKKKHWDRHEPYQPVQEIELEFADLPFDHDNLWTQTTLEKPAIITTTNYINKLVPNWEEERRGERRGERRRRNNLHLPLPSPDAENATWESLRPKNIPDELIDYILELALAKKGSILTVPDDPLHPRNEDALLKYLDHCWNILVRCNMMSRELGQTHTMGNRVREVLYAFLSGKCEEMHALLFNRS